MRAAETTTEIVPDLCPGIARELGASGWDQPRTSFLNWAAERIETLRARATPELTREERFEIHNDMATLTAAAYAYGQWLLAKTG